MFKKITKSKIGLHHIIIIFIVGVMTGAFVIVGFILPLYSSPVPTGCQDTALLITVTDQDGNLLEGASIILYDMEDLPIVSGNTNENGVFIHESNVYGCQEDSIKIWLQGEHLGTPWTYEMLVSTSEDVCQRDPLTGYCEITIVINLAS